MQRYHSRSCTTSTKHIHWSCVRSCLIKLGHIADWTVVICTRIAFLAAVVRVAAGPRCDGYPRADQTFYSCSSSAGSARGISVNLFQSLCFSSVNSHASALCKSLGGEKTPALENEFCASLTVLRGIVCSTHRLSFEVVLQLKCLVLSGPVPKSV